MTRTFAFLIGSAALVSGALPAPLRAWVGRSLATS